MTFLNGLSRFFVCTAVVWFADAFMPTFVAFASFWQVMGVGFTLAALSILMDLTLLPAIASALSAAFWDTIAAAMVLYFSQFFLMNATVTWTGAWITAVLLGLTEIGMHAWIRWNTRRGSKEQI